MARLSNPVKANTFKGEKQEEEPIVSPPVDDVVPGKEKKKGKEKKEKAPPKERVPRERTPEEKEKSVRRYRVLGLLCLLLSAFMLFSFTTYLQTRKSD